MEEKEKQTIKQIGFFIVTNQKKREKERYCIWIKTNYILLIYFSDIKTKMKKIRLALSSPLDKGSQKNPKPKKNWTKNKCEIYSNSLKKYCEHVT